MKIKCTKCSQEKQETEFYKRKLSKTHYSYCKQCKKVLDYDKYQIKKKEQNEFSFI